MKKPIIVLGFVIAVMLLAWSVFAPSYAQEAAKEERPTFYRLTPGVYVNGWPRFTIHYPKDWVERQPMPQEVFRASAPGPVHFPAFAVTPMWSPPFTLFDKYTDHLSDFFRATAKIATVVSDKPSHLQDGTPAKEVEFQVFYNGEPFNWFALGTKKGDLVINTGVGGPNVRIGEDLKAILYSLEFQPGKDEPVKVPPDVQEFLDRDDNDIVSHDVAKVMSHFSDGYLNSGVRKGEMERFWRQNIGGITLSQKVITDFVPAGDRAYLTGFVNSNLGKPPIRDTSIIKENGEWKWYGNQRDVSPR